MDNQTPFVIVFPRGQLSPKDKERFTKHGILAVEADDPKSVVQLSLERPLVMTSSKIDGDDIVRACLQSLASQEPATAGGSITSSGRASHAFVQSLAAAVAQKP